MSDPVDWGDNDPDEVDLTPPPVPDPTAPFFPDGSTRAEIIHLDEAARRKFQAMPALGSPALRPWPKDEPVAVDDKAAEILAATNPGLPDEFWEARDYLAHIRDAAWSRGRSAEAVLGTVLARVAAVNDHSIQLPPIVGAPCGLSLIVALVGKPGQGKGTGRHVGIDLIDRGAILNPDLDNVPPGSGEGLAEMLMGTVTEPDPIENKTRSVRKQVHYNCFVYVDEGEILARHTNRTSGSTIIPTLKSMFTSGPLGQANANSDRRRIIPGGSYVYGILLGIQPEKAGPIFDDIGGGLPQRFLWMPTGGVPIPPPDERDEWPGALALPDVALGPGEVVDGTKRYRFQLAPTVKAEVLANDYDRVQHGCAELEEHQDLIRLKVAGILAIMDGRLAITDNDWRLAGMVIDTSRNTRDAVLDALALDGQKTEDAYRRKIGGREVAKVEAVERRRTIDAARKIAGKVHTDDDWWTVADMRRAMRNYRDVFAEGVDHAKAERWIVEHNEPGQGQDKRLLRPGPVKP